MSGHLQHPQGTPPRLQAASYSPGGEALNNLWQCFGGWFQPMAQNSCLRTLPSAAAWTKRADKAGTFRAWATYAAKAHHCPFCIIPLARPSSPMPPIFLSHNPENAFFFLFKSGLIVPGRMGRAAGRTMQVPFSQDVSWSSQGRKMLTVGLPQRAAFSSSLSFPSPAGSPTDPGCLISSHSW